MVRDYKKFVQDTHFRKVKPFQKSPYRYDVLSTTTTFNFDVENTNISPLLPQTTLEYLQKICTIPRMSTIAIGALINFIVSQMKDDTAFVNVGVWHGFTLLAGMVNNPQKTCIGVDNFSEYGGPQNEFLDRFATYKSDHHHFFNMGYENYFQSFHKNTPIGFYLYDGDHSQTEQRRGLEIAEPYFADDCIIMVDDINWYAPLAGSLEFMANSVHKYKILVQQHTLHNCHPTYWNGFLLVQKVPSPQATTS